MRFLFAFLPLAFFSFPSYAQQTEPGDFFEELTLQTDSAQYSTSKNTLITSMGNSLTFVYHDENEICEVKLYPSTKRNFKKISLLQSGDFTLVDSLVYCNNQYYSFKVQFKNLSRSSFLKFRFNLTADSTSVMKEINLFPTTETSAKLDIRNNELAVGEEKVFELITNHPENIKQSPEWTQNQDIDYRVTQNNGQTLVHIVANIPGQKNLILTLQTNKPRLVDQQPVYSLHIITYSFNVKAANIAYLQADKNDITLDEKTKNEGVDVQLDYNRLMQMNRTYLIEAQQTSGSPLIAEIYTRDKISNNKVLCRLRAYNYHRKSDGYLFIKDNDEARFITNFNIIPKVTIESIKIMRNGKDWKEETSIYPGETFNLRIEGQSLDKVKFHFDELIPLANDSVIKNEHYVEFKLKVPLNISKKSIDIFADNQNTGKSLTITEYQRARPFDYINVSFGDRRRKVSEIQGPELYDKLIKDVVISFLPDKIDADNKLFGKQYLSIEVRIMGKKGELVEYTTIDDVVINPGENSPRYSFYDKSDSKNGDISLNEKLSNSTYDLKDWSRIKLTFKNSKDHYTHDVQSKTVEIILQKRYSFDIDVSFPAGLLIKKMDKPGFGNFGGVSMAVIAQYSFYDKDKINHLKPYKFGVGFLAMNAFNFSQNASDRDMGVVAIATINPVNTDRKLSFPIYLGGGYLLSEKTWFWLIGPGISVSF
jgi:hypothetical protein